VAEASYYARRSARDPGWREAAIAAAAERKRRRRERDPEAFRLAHLEEQRRCWQAQAASGLTFAELLRRVGGDRETLAHVLRDELRRGRVEYLGLSRCYRVNGQLPEDVREALRNLRL
jgi:hypothetical protein